MDQRLFCLALLACAIGCLAKSAAPSAKSIPQERQDRYKSLILEYFSSPRHPLVFEDKWLYARSGVISEFQSILGNVPNTSLVIQDFITEILQKPNFPEKVQGQNIIVTFRGRNYGTSYDNILVIGAHYDSDSSSMLSVDDNGSGVVAMLEVARGLADSITSRRAAVVNTVIFVAFDVQRFEHELVGELEHGAGSTFYVRESLAPLLNSIEPKPTFTGAIILDAVMNYNESEGSQILQNGYEKSFPEVYANIKHNNFSGNFMNMVTKSKLRSLQLDNFFSQKWSQTDTSNKYPLWTLELRQDIVSPAVFEFIRQDHLAFWNYAVGAEESPLPAILITDTGKWRGIEHMCGETKCNSTSFLTKERLDFLDQVVLTIDRFISETQIDGIIDAKPNKGTSWTSSLPSMITIFLLAYLI